MAWNETLNLLYKIKRNNMFHITFLLFVMRHSKFMYSKVLTNGA